MPDLTEEEIKQMEELVGRDAKGRYVKKTVQAPPIVETPAPLITPPIVNEPATVDPYVIKYADSLKAKLGDKYNAKFEAMEIKQRINSMEATIEVLSSITAPIIKSGEGEGVGGVPPPVDTKPKTFLELQKESDYQKKLRDRGSYLKVAQNLYK